MNGREKRLFAVVLALGFLVVVLSGYITAMYVLAEKGNNPNSSEQHTLVVTGIGTVKARANLAVLQLGVLTRGATATEAVQRNAEAMNRVIEALKAVGIKEEDMETSGFSLYPVYSDYCEPKIIAPTIIGYGVSNTLTIRVTDLQKAGPAIDEAVEAGANQVYGLYFTFTDEKLAELQQQARVKAVEDARARATTIAAGLGVQIVGVAFVSEGGYYPIFPVARYGEAAFSGTPVLPSEEQITVTVQVTFIIQ